MKSLFLITLLITVFAIGGTIAAYGQSEMAKCYVKDPTGTPLNLRSSPNGRVIAKLRNGTVLYTPIGDNDGASTNYDGYIQVYRRQKGKYYVWGFVFHDYTTCP